MKKKFVHGKCKKKCRARREPILCQHRRLSCILCMYDDNRYHITDGWYINSMLLENYREAEKKSVIMSCDILLLNQVRVYLSEKQNPSQAVAYQLKVDKIRSFS